VLALGLPALASATLEQLSLNDMVQKSTAIVRGTVAASHTEARGPISYTHYTIGVTDNKRLRPSRNFGSIKC
jgi:hypothetical protein